MAQQPCPHCPSETNSTRHFFEAHPEIVVTWESVTLDPEVGTVTARLDSDRG